MTYQLRPTPPRHLVISSSPPGGPKGAVESLTTMPYGAAAAVLAAIHLEEVGILGVIAQQLQVVAVTTTHHAAILLGKGGRCPYYM